MKILHYKTAKSHHDFTSRAGLMAPATLLERLGLGKIIDRMMPAPGSNRGYRHSIVFETFLLMFHEGAQCLEDVRHLRKERGLVGLMGFRSLPCAATLGNWLRRVGRHKPSRDALQEVNRRLLAAGLKDQDRVTLDMDASVVHAKKKTAKRTYQGKRGYTPMFGHIAESGQIAYCEMRKGNVPPAARNVEFFQRCLEALPEGVKVSQFRADAASYQAAVINFCRRHGIRFAIRAKADRTVKDAIASIPEDAWQPLRLADGSLSETESVARTVHVMGDTPEAFCLVVQRKVVEKPVPKDPHQPVQVELEIQDRNLYSIDEESTRDGQHIYRAMATDLDREGWDDHEIVRWYNQRADCSENRLKECRSDFSGARLPCSGFRANAVYLMLSAMSYNLLCLMRLLLLPAAWCRKRAITFRHRLYAMAGQIVHHGRQRTLKVRPADLGLLEETLWILQNCRLA